jgi:aldose 1-epimerase
MQLRRKPLAVAAAALVVMGSSAAALARAHHHPPRGGGSLTITHKQWGMLSTGTAVDMYTLRNGGQMAVEISNYGGIVQSIWVPDRTGRLRDVALGFPDTQAGLTQYETDFTNPPSGGSGDTYSGAIIGRYANRIANHSFTLNGHTYNLVGNNGPNNINTLHGGPNAYNTQV